MLKYKGYYIPFEEMTDKELDIYDDSSQEDHCFCADCEGYCHSFNDCDKCLFDCKNFDVFNE